MEPITIYRLYCLLNACWKHTIHHKEVIIIIILKILKYFEIKHSEIRNNSPM